jgi:hypothetical protein
LEKILIGIDPDTDKSGFAMKFGKSIFLKNLRFFELLQTLHSIKKNPDYSKHPIIVYVECGFLNGGNRHFKNAASTAFNGKISERVGANHEVAKKICEMCEFLGLEYHQVKPTSSKKKADEFRALTKITSKTNQEQRDAYLLIWEK